MNDRSISFDFDADLLRTDILFKICKMLKLSNIYIDIFDINYKEIDFPNKLVKKNDKLIISLIENQSSYAVKATVDDIPLIVETLPKGFSGELNLWDTYTDWQQYLKDKVTHKHVSKTPDPKVYLNYNSL